MNKELDKPIIVQKYGGSSLASAELINKVAANIVARKQNGVHVIVVVSAMGKTTDQFVKLAGEVNSKPSAREMDMLLSIGERVSISLVTMAINAIGKYSAISYTGSQVGIVTDTNHTEARILEVKGHRIREALAEDKIVVIAGFQGVSINKEITTLGRGGSDTTAVAIAAGLNAEACEIMSDVDGIYSADPRILPVAKRINKIHFDEALEMAACGAKMLKRTSVEFAKQHKIKLSLGSSTTGYIGTIVTDEKMTNNSVTSIVNDDDFILLKITNTDIIYFAESLSKYNIRPKFWQSLGKTISLGLSKNDYQRAKELFDNISVVEKPRPNLCTISIVGPGVGIGSLISAKVLQIIKDSKEHCFGIQNGELYFKIIVPVENMKYLLEKFHNTFFNRENE
jgi:aspartate kinase